MREASLAVAALVVASALAGCAERAPAWPAPTRDARELPEWREVPVVLLTGWIVGNGTGPEADDPCHRVGTYKLDAGNRTLHHLARGVGIPAKTEVVVITRGEFEVSWQKSRCGGFGSITPQPRGPHRAAVFEPPFYWDVPFTWRDGVLETGGTRLGAGEGLDFEVNRTTEGATFTGWLRLRNDGNWTVHRMNATCETFEQCGT